MKNLISKQEKDLIDAVCNEYEIENYKINPDGTIDVYGDVDLSGNNFDIIAFPVKFGEVRGSFDCSYTELMNLEGAPHTVGGNFDCSSSYLTTLFGSPKYIGGDFHCESNKLTTLEHGPLKVDRGYYCYSNDSLTSLIGSPKIVGGDFQIGSIKIVALMDSPEHVGGDFHCIKCPKLISAYMGSTDMYLGGKFGFKNAILPLPYTDSLKVYQELILKYQRHFYVWNDDFSLNEENLNELISEIKDGLE
jgi:hypothetical protein